VNALLFVHLLAAMTLVGALLAAAIAARHGDDRLQSLVRGSAIAALTATVVTIGLGEGLAANEHASGGWLDASRGLAVFGLLLGSAALAVLAAWARTRVRLRQALSPTAVVLVLVALATAFVMAAKPV
jgi:hypothetical protein